MECHSALGKHLYAAATSLAGVKQATVNQNDQISTGREAKCGIYNVIRAFRELRTSDFGEEGDCWVLEDFATSLLEL